MALANDGGDGGVPRRTEKVKRKNTSTGRNGPRQGLRGNQGLKWGEKSDSGSEIRSGRESDPVVRDQEAGKGSHSERSSDLRNRTKTSAQKR